MSALISQAPPPYEAAVSSPPQGVNATYPASFQATCPPNYDGGYPTQPQGAYPTQPPGAYPTQPQGAYPIQPQGAHPTQPQGAYPIQPQGAHPTQPQGAYPTQPQGAYPTQPQGAYPAQPYPSQSQRFFPVQSQLQHQQTNVTVVTSQPSMVVGVGARKPDNFVHLSLISIFCFCWVFGIIALIYSLRVDSAWARGDITAANQNSRNAKGWNIAAIVGGVVSIVLVIVTSILSNSAQYQY